MFKNFFQELSKITYKEDLSAYLARNSLSDIAEFKPPADLTKQIASLSITNGIEATHNGENGEIIILTNKY